MRQLLIAIVLILLAVIFAFQNSDPVRVHFYFWEFTQASMAFVLLLTLVIGLITGMLLFAAGMYKRNQTINAQKKRILDLEKEITKSKSF